MNRIFVVTNEPVWPVRSGGRARMAALIAEVARVRPVIVLEPAHPGSGDALDQLGVTRRVLRPPGSRIVAMGCGSPWSAACVLGRPGLAALERMVEQERPLAVLFTHSYLAVGARLAGTPFVVDFQNIECERFRSLAAMGGPGKRALFAMEARRARRWEPGIARRADRCLAVSERDASVLQSWGSENVIVVTNPQLVPKRPPTVSPANGYVLFLANMTYPPNAAAAAWLLSTIWPEVLRRRPAARLVVAGAGSNRGHLPVAPGVEILGWVDDLDELYAGASIVVAPVRNGAGSQIKIAEALAHRRVVVATTFSARSRTPESGDGLVVADETSAMADALVSMTTDITLRWRREASIRGPDDALRKAMGRLLGWFEQLESEGSDARRRHPGRHDIR